jgi:hypothetical protein
MSTYTFIETDLETILTLLNKLTPDTKPQWGSMTAQRMVEHLTDTIQIATGKNPQELLVPEDRLPKMLLFLESDKPMAQNIEVPFALPETSVRNEELELAIDEFVEEYLEFMEMYENDDTLAHIHPYYGPLKYEQWQRLHQKHLSHHFHQFGLI